MDRLPRIQSRSKSSMSRQSSLDEKFGENGLVVPGGFLRRLREDETPTHSRSSSLQPRFRRKKWDTGIGPGGPVSQSAIGPIARTGEREDGQDLAPTTDSDTLAIGSEDVSPDTSLHKDKGRKAEEPQEEIYQEGDRTVIEDEEGNVLEVMESKRQPEEERLREAKAEGRKLMREKNVEHGVSQTKGKPQGDEIGRFARAIESKVQSQSSTWRDVTKRMGGFGGLTKREDAGPSKKPEQKKRGPALAYQFGNTIIIEDQDGEVLKKYDIPSSVKSRPKVDHMQSFTDTVQAKNRLQKMGAMLGMGTGGNRQQYDGDNKDDNYNVVGPSIEIEDNGLRRKKTRQEQEGDEDDKNIRFISAGGRRMSKAEFIEQIQRMDPKSRNRIVEDSNASEAVKREIRLDGRESNLLPLSESSPRPTGPLRTRSSSAEIRRMATHEDRPHGPDGLTLVTSSEEEIPFYPVSDELAQFAFGAGGRETPAQRRRRLAPSEAAPKNTDEDTEGWQGRPSLPASSSPNQRLKRNTSSYRDDEQETAAEKRRRQAALGMPHEENSESSSSSDEEEDLGNGFREPKPRRPSSLEIERVRELMEERGQPERQSRQTIRFAELPDSRRESPTRPPPVATAGGSKLRWGRNTTRERRKD